MYNSGFTQAKMGLAAKNLRRSKERSCGYYMRIVLFFSSLIQSLIIVSLVLFLVYGEPQQTVEEKRIKELEQSYSRLSLENVALRAKEKDLTLQLNLTLTAKRFCENNITTLRKLANTSSITISTLKSKWTECVQSEMQRRNSVPHVPRMPCALPTNDKYLEQRLQQAQQLQTLIRANFSEQLLSTKHELESAQKDRIRYQLEGIELRRDKSLLEERLDIYERKCKEDFIKSLQGIPDVTKEFLRRVDDLFAKHISFQLTCDKQSIQLENIRANCSSLSTEVENKLQSYLDSVGSKITTTVGANAKCMTENKRLMEDTSWCLRNRSEIIEVNKKVVKKSQESHDKESEKLLLDISKLNANKILLENTVAVKDIEIKMLSEKFKDLNASLANCKIGPFPGAPSNPYSGYSGSAFGTGIGYSGLGSNTGLGTSGSGRTSSSLGASSGIGLGGTGFGFPKPGHTNTLTSSAGGAGLGSPGLALPNAGWPGLGSTGAGLPGLGSTGSAMAGQGRTGVSSTGIGGAGYGSVGSSGTTLSKPGTGLGPNTVGASTFGVGKTATGNDQLAQITQHLKELHQFTKTD